MISRRSRSRLLICAMEVKRIKKGNGLEERREIEGVGNRGEKRRRGKKKFPNKSPRVNRK